MKQLKRIVMDFDKRMHELGNEDAIKIVNKTIIRLLSTYCAHDDAFEIPSSLIIRKMEAFGQYNHRNNVIALSPSTANIAIDIVLDDEESVMNKINTFLHEHRHCAQFTQCERFDDLLTKDHMYMMPYTQKGEEFTNHAYKHRPVEVDARLTADAHEMKAYIFICTKIGDVLDDIVLNTQLEMFNI